MSAVHAVAHPNIALAKYWGKARQGGNVPAVPSLSLTLAGLSTHTSVELDPALDVDAFELGGQPASADDAAKTSRFLDLVRGMAGRQERARVISRNDFPTSSGLASSASGFAALAVASAHAYGLELSRGELASLAQRGSTSAARSLISGFAELRPEGHAQPVSVAEGLDVRVLVCVTTEAEKSLSSRQAMARTVAESPYYEAWMQFAVTNFEALRAALLRGDWPSAGACLEASAFAMHASALGARILFFNDLTMRVHRRVEALRAEGISAWSSMDAGAHVKVFVRAGDEAERARAALERVEGLVRVIEAAPGLGARRVDAPA